MTLKDGLFMVGHLGPDYRNPRNSGAGSANMYVYVDDAAAHYERAKAAGAEIIGNWPTPSTVIVATAPSIAGIRPAAL